MGRAMIYAFMLDIMLGLKSDGNGELFELFNRLNELDMFVDDAERKQFTERGYPGSVNVWLIELQHAVYRCEELLLETQIKTTTQSFPFQIYPLQKISQYRRVRETVKGLDALLEKKKELGLTAGDIVDKEQLQGLPSSSAVLHSYFYSNHRKDAFYGSQAYESLLEHLLSTSAGASKHIKGINIVGKAGVGKTALADAVYFNHEVRKSFKPRAWVSSMPDGATVTSIAKKILEAVTEQFVAENDLHELRKLLNKSFEKKKFLLVLDDFWVDEKNWSMLIDCFGSAAEGSAIIWIPGPRVYPNMLQVQPPTSYTVDLDSWTGAECWSIFMVHACASGQIDLLNRPRLELIGREIVRKLKNLPLGARMIGSLLQDKLDEEKWLEILNSELLDEGDDYFRIIHRVLVLCYLDLPAQIKRCFAYLSIFPKGYHFEQKEVVLLWMAQGFLKIPDSESNLEDIGDKYFGHLIERSFLQPLGSGDRFIMHDLVHDLAIRVFGGSYKYHLFYFYPGIETFPESRPTGTPVRTFLSREHFNPSLLMDVINKLDGRALRALSLSHCDITYKPGSTGRPSHILALADFIRRQKHLCYLDLSFTSLDELPDSICNLLNLQTLLLRNCRLLESLPRRIYNLKKLRYLDVRGTSVKKMPMKMRGLISLRTLTDFIISKNGPRLEDLAGLSHLKTLAISVAYPEDGAILKEMKSLDDLMIHWCYEDLDRMQWLENLEPCKDLKSLTIEAYPGKTFPKWLGDSSYRTLQLVALRHCTNCCKLPTLGLLPSLKDLSIEGFSSVEVIGSEFYGNITASQKPFQSLESLLFRDMLNWRNWAIVEGTEFPLLIKLCIINCPKLMEGFPEHLPSLKKMEIIGCRGLKAPLPKVCNTCEVFVDETYEVKTHSQASLRRVTISEAHEIPSQSYSGFPSSKHTTGSSFSEIEEIPPQSPGSELPVDFPSSHSKRIPEQIDPESSMAKADSLITTQADILPHTDTPTTTAAVKVETLSKQDLDDQQSSIEVLKVSTVSQLSFLPPKLHSLKIEGQYY